jgi:hypothetical protein
MEMLGTIALACGATFYLILAASIVSAALKRSRRRKPDRYARAYELLAENKLKAEALQVAIDDYRKRFPE